MTTLMPVEQVFDVEVRAGDWGWTWSGYADNPAAALSIALNASLDEGLDADEEAP